MRAYGVVATAAAAFVLAGCVTIAPVPDDQMGARTDPRDAPPPTFTRVGGGPRDTDPVARPHVPAGYKPARPAAEAPFAINAPLTYARFDDALAVSEAIGDAPPDFAFRLIGSEAWAWADPSGEMLIVEGEGRATVQYFFGPRDDVPQFIRAADYGFAFADGELIGMVHSNGAIVAARLLGTGAEDARRLAVRGRALFHAANDRRWDRETAERWTTVQPVYGGWVSSWIAPPVWTGDYGRYRDRPESRERRERRRLTREQRRERAERFARWRQGGGVGAPPGPGTLTPGDGTGLTPPPRDPARPGRPGRPGRPEQPLPPPADTSGGTSPPADPARPGRPPRPERPPVPPTNPAPIDSDPPPPDAPPQPDDPVRVLPPQPPMPTPVNPRTPRRRDAPGWQGHPTEQPHQTEPDAGSNAGRERVIEAPALLDPDTDARHEAERTAEAARRAQERAAADAAERAEAAERQRAAEDRAAEHAAAQAAAEAQQRAAAERAAAERAAAEARSRQADAPRLAADGEADERPQ